MWHVAKLMEKLFLPKLNEHLQPDEHQHGFRMHHSALQHIQMGLRAKNAHYDPYWSSYLKGLRHSSPLQVLPPQHRVNGSPTLKAMVAKPMWTSAAQRRSTQDVCFVSSHNLQKEYPTRTTAPE